MNCEMQRLTNDVQRVSLNAISYSIDDSLSNNIETSYFYPEQQIREHQCPEQHLVGECPRLNPCNIMDR